MKNTEFMFKMSIIIDAMSLRLMDKIPTEEWLKLDTDEQLSVLAGLIDSLNLKRESQDD